MFKLTIPVLHVESSLAAQEFYCIRLGFQREFAYRPGDAKDPCYMGVVHDDARLHISSFPGDGVSGALVCLVVDDVHELHKDLLRRHFAVDMPPTDQTWGNREMYVRDDDRNKVAFVRPTTRRSRGRRPMRLGPPVQVPLKSGAHSIWELVLHLCDTYGLVLRRLGGDGRQLTELEELALCARAQRRELE